jgi:hypothetical protein
MNIRETAQGLWFFLWFFALIFTTWAYGLGAAALFLGSSIAVTGWTRD